MLESAPCLHTFLVCVDDRGGPAPARPVATPTQGPRPGDDSRDLAHDREAQLTLLLAFERHTREGKLRRVAFTTTLEWQWDSREGWRAMEMED